MKTKIIVIVAVLTVVIGTYFFVKRKDYMQASIADTLNYSEADYEQMRTFFNSDSILVNAINSHGSADSNGIKIKKLLRLPYDSRFNSGMNKTEIDELILLYYTSKETLEKFRRIDSSLLEFEKDTLSVP